MHHDCAEKGSHDAQLVIDVHAIVVDHAVCGRGAVDDRFDLANIEESVELDADEVVDGRRYCSVDADMRVTPCCRSCSALAYHRDGHRWTPRREWRHLHSCKRRGNVSSPPLCAWSRANQSI